jgi:hypothetical protein
VPGRQLESIQTAATLAGPAYDVLDLCWNGDWQDRRGPHMMLVFGAARLPGISLEFGGVAVPVRESARHFLYLTLYRGSVTQHVCRRATSKMEA